MREDFIAKNEIFLDATRDKVWEALTDPEQVTRYLHGTQVESDWKVGSPIAWRGEWKGRHYEDKGRILEMEPPHRLATTYWSSLSGKPDRPEYYKTLRYVLYEEGEEGEGTRLVLTTENNATEQEARHSQENWKGVLDTLKAILEEETAAASGF
jgi:uncharacterized protein YndB with AHSA1/START domain